MPFISKPKQHEGDILHQQFPAPRLQPGEIVRTLVGDVDGCVVKTVRTGVIAWYGWHFKRCCWLYKLAVNGRPRGRWYLECQLTPQMLCPPSRSGIAGAEVRA